MHVMTAHIQKHYVISDKVYSSNTLVLSFATSLESPGMLSDILRLSTTLQTNSYPELWEKHKYLAILRPKYFLKIYPYRGFIKKNHNTNILILFSGFFTPNI